MTWAAIAQAATAAETVPRLRVGPGVYCDRGRTYYHVRPDRWEPGERVEHHSTCRESGVEITPGLYSYSGFGIGTLYLADGVEVGSVRRDEAEAVCAAAGLRFRYFDCLSGYGIAGLC